MRIALLAVNFLAGGGDCTEETTLPLHSAFLIGASRAAIQQVFRYPNTIDTLDKTSESIWGAIEPFWSSVSLGSTVEVWSYQS